MISQKEKHGNLGRMQLAMLPVDPLANDPRNRKGKEFRRLFKVPLQILPSNVREIVRLCRLRGLGVPAAFNYAKFCVDGFFSAPLELKVITI
jgi:hypothetical protein